MAPPSSTSTSLAIRLLRVSSPSSTSSSAVAPTSTTAGTHPLPQHLQESKLTHHSLASIVDYDGTIYPLTAALESTPVPLTELSIKGIRIQGSLVGSRDSVRKLLEFAARKNITPTIMTYSLNEDGIEKALHDLKDGKVRYRAVLIKE